MLPSQDETLIRTAFSAARALEPGDAEVARAISRARLGSRHAFRPGATGSGRRVAASILAGAALVASGLYAVPSTRAAVDGLAETVGGALGSWIGGDSGDAPGRALVPGEQAPAYFHEGPWAGEHVKQPRVIAEAGGYKLYAYLERQGTVGFDLGDTGVGLGGYTAGDFDRRALYVLGPAAMHRPDPDGHVPLFGIAARSVSAVELRYETGPPLRVNGIRGGFVLLAEPDRGPREVVALDAGGNEIERQLVDYSEHPGPRIDWRQYGTPAEQGGSAG